MPTAAEFLAYVEKYVNTYGLIIVPIGAFLENSVILGFIFPGVTLIFLSGFVTRSSGESIWLIIMLATIGSFLGDNLDYFIGRRAGTILESKPLFSKPVTKIEPILAKHGVWAIFAGRFLGWSRAWVALASGVVRYPYWKFSIVSLISAAVWASVWIIGGYLLGGRRVFIEEWLTRASIFAWLMFGAIIIYYLRTRIKLVYDLVVYEVKKHGRRLKNGFKGS